MSTELYLTVYVLNYVLTDSSSSEYESDDNEIEPTGNSPPTLRETNKQVYSLVRWVTIFVCLWQALFTISDAAVELLLKFITTFLRLLASLIRVSLLSELVANMPGILYLLKKYLESDTESFTNYVVCPTCFTLYKLEDCFSLNEMGEKVPKRCSHVQFPNHPQRSYRLPCSTSLLTKVNMSGGRIKYVPRYTYAYQSIKHSLQRLLYRPGFTELLEHWRKRQSKEGCMSDVYDGQVWNNFKSEKFSNFLQNKRCYGVMLNFDFFQPYKHTPESYGVFYITLMNLPRDQRFKQENVLLVGIIPAFEHEPSLYSFVTFHDKTKHNALTIDRVSNRKSRSMQNEFISVVSSRPTLGKIETMPQIGYALGKVRDNAILNYTCKYKKRLRDQHHAHRGRSTS